MHFSLDWLYRRAKSRLAAAALLGAVLACAGPDGLNPSAEVPADPAGDATPPAIADSPAAPADSTATVATDSVPALDTVGASVAGMVLPGIPFGSYNMKSSNLTSMYNATMMGVDPPYIMSELALARSKGGRVILKMTGGPASRIQNSDRTFSITKWQNLVNGFTKLDLNSYIADGTLIGHFLIDEPQNANRWGGKVISHATVEALAQYSKQRWPGLTTFARARPTWLEKTSITYVNLDAGWAQYVSAQGDATKWIAAEVAAAKRKRLGLAVGVNYLDGGNGSSGIRGWSRGKWAMSATELKNYSTPLLNQTYSCAFLGWTYVDGGAEYLARADVKNVMSSLSNLAKAHVKTSCRQ